MLRKAHNLWNSVNIPIKSLILFGRPLIFWWVIVSDSSVSTSFFIPRGIMSIKKSPFLSQGFFLSYFTFYIETHVFFYHFHFPYLYLSVGPSYQFLSLAFHFRLFPCLSHFLDWESFFHLLLFHLLEVP